MLWRRSFWESDEKGLQKSSLFSFAWMMVESSTQDSAGEYGLPYRGKIRPQTTFSRFCEKSSLALDGVPPYPYFWLTQSHDFSNLGEVKSNTKRQPQKWDCQRVEDITFGTNGVSAQKWY